jgi:hypothetical protein
MHACAPCAHTNAFSKTTSHAGHAVQSKQCSGRRPTLPCVSEVLASSRPRYFLAGSAHTRKSERMAASVTSLPQFVVRRCRRPAMGCRLKNGVPATVRRRRKPRADQKCEPITCRFHKRLASVLCRSSRYRLRATAVVLNGSHSSPPPAAGRRRPYGVVGR